MNAYIPINITGRGGGAQGGTFPFPSHLSLIIIAELLQTSCIVVSSPCTPALWSRRGQLELATTILLNHNHPRYGDYAVYRYICE